MMLVVCLFFFVGGCGGSGLYIYIIYIDWRRFQFHFVGLMGVRFRKLPYVLRIR